MTEDRGHGKLLSDAAAAIRAVSAERRMIDDDMRRYAARSRRIGGAYRKKLLDKVLVAAGSDAAEIAHRQSDNDAADTAFMDSLRPRLDANAAAVARRQAAFLANFRKSHGRAGSAPPGPPSPPGAPEQTLFILTTADHVERDVAPGLQHQVSITPWHNTVKALVEANQQQTSVVVLEFAWTPPRDGTIKVLSVVAVNGSYWWASQHGCVEALVEQSVGVDLYAYDSAIGQDSAILLDGDSAVDHYWDDFPGCSSDMGSKVADQPLFLEFTGGYAVTAGKPIVIAAVVSFEFWSDEARGQIDFMSGDRVINITSVILNLD